MHFRTIREKIPAKERELAAQAATDQFIRQPFFKESQHLACYASYRDELSTEPLRQAIWQAKKTLYLPMLTEDKTLVFAKVTPNAALQANRFGILEPSDPLPTTLPADELDLVVVPMLAFDRALHRLGTGGGYYDRTFAFLLHEPKPSKPVLVGLAYAAQQINALTVDEWDVSLNAVVTENDTIMPAPH